MKTACELHEDLEKLTEEEKQKNLERIDSILKKVAVGTGGLVVSMVNVRFANELGLLFAILSEQVGSAMMNPAADEAQKLMKLLLVTVQDVSQKAPTQPDKSVPKKSSPVVLEDKPGAVKSRNTSGAVADKDPGAIISTPNVFQQPHGKTVDKQRKPRSDITYS